MPSCKLLTQANIQSECLCAQPRNVGLEATRARVDRPDMDSPRVLPTRAVLTHASVSGCHPGLAPLLQSERGQYTPKEGLLSGRHMGTGPTPLLVLPTLALSWRAVCASLRGSAYCTHSGGVWPSQAQPEGIDDWGSEEIVIYLPLASPPYS